MKRTVVAIAVAIIGLTSLLLPSGPVQAAPAHADKSTAGTWFLAEGSTAWGFITYISVVNPNAHDEAVTLTYMKGDGSTQVQNITLPAFSQATVNPVEEIGSADFSTVVTCDDGDRIGVDRTMAWAASGSIEMEAHNSIGTAAPSETWFLPEGTSGWGFETWLLIQNPNAVDAECDVTYMLDEGGSVTVPVIVPANSRMSYSMAEHAGEVDASIMVSTDSATPVIAERSVYRNNRREGHCSVGSPVASTTYYLAEGTSAWGFTTYVLVQNPNDDEAEVTISFLDNEGAHPQEPFTIAAKSRRTIRVNDIFPDKDFSTIVSSSVPVVAERAMYWQSQTGEVCHASIGTVLPVQGYLLADGQTSFGYETYLLVQNPNDQALTVEVTYMTPLAASNVTFTSEIPANSRATFNMADKGIRGRAAAVVVSTDPGLPIIAERSIYWNDRGVGTETIGVPLIVGAD